MNQWKESKEKFINPYTFIKLCKKPERFDMKTQNTENTYRGVIECSLKTRTEIFIPDTSNEFAFGKDLKCSEHKSYDFFSYKKGIPVIPGSEIKGMIRSAFEAVTNSCMSSVDNIYSVSRTIEPKKQCLIKWDNEEKKWYLYDAKRYKLGVKKINVIEGLRVKSDSNGKRYIELNKKKYYNKNRVKFNASGYIVTDIGKGTNEGYLYLGEDFPKKNYDSIFVVSPNSKCELEDEAVERFKRILEVYSDNRINKNINKGHTGYKDYKLSMTDYNPCWYNKIGNNIYISPACISKNAYENTLYKFLGEYQPCVSKNNICKACSLFGMVSKSEAVSSRLRFTDANLIDNGNGLNCFSNIITLQELSTPKNTAVEFYTIRPKNAKVWTYDYKVKSYSGNGKSSQPNYEPINNLELNGRKFYWHSSTISHTKEKTERNVTIRPLKKGTEFNFNIYYDKLTEQELKELIWVLNIGENDDECQCHKIGMGKPLGLGSVKIKVNKIKNRKISLLNNKIKYTIIDSDLNLKKYVDCNPFNLENNTIKQFLKITKINSTKGYKVSYPLGDNGEGRPNSEASHQWFIGNKLLNGNSSYKPEIKYTLPKVFDTLTLPKLVKDSRTKN